MSTAGSFPGMLPFNAGGLVGGRNPFRDTPNMGVNPKIGGKPPKWMVYFMENPYVQMDGLGVPLFLEIHPYHIVTPTLQKNSELQVSHLGIIVVAAGIVVLARQLYPTAGFGGDVFYIAYNHPIGSIYHLYTRYILPSRGLYNPYHLLPEPE